MEENKKLSEMLKDIYGSLTDEQKAKVKECKTADELVKLAGKEGIELPDEVLDAVAGGYLEPHWRKGEIVGYHVLKDSDGSFLDYADSEYIAKKYARNYGQSEEIISVERAQELRGKKSC